MLAKVLTWHSVSLNSFALLALPDSSLTSILATVDEWPVPHAATAVVHHGTVIATHGDTDRVFRLASISKVITSWTCLIAVEEGSVSLDDAVGPPGATLRHCLAHAAGYGFDTSSPIMGVGKRRIYSNTGIEMAANHVAERTGMMFGDYMNEAIFEPLGMSDTYLKASPAYAVLSTVDDMSLFLTELMRPALISSATAHEATTIQYPELGGVIPGLGSYKPNPWGLGIEIRDHKQPHWTGSLNSPQTFGHFGGSGTMMWIDPNIDVGLISLTNRNFDEWSAEALVAWPSLSDAVIRAITNHA
jgi:CubicO group peptidase (beta-lactamase class C family)